MLGLSFCVLPLQVNAQFDEPTYPGDDPDLPIDGGVTILLAAGVAYGVKKYREERKKNNIKH